jgi:uncharacterized membrane protein
MPRKKVQSKITKEDRSKVVDPIYAVLVLSGLLRIFAINQSLWLDEATTALTTKLSYFDIFTQFTPKDFHPPLYYFLMKFITSFSGNSEIALRVPSVFAGIATVFVIYLIGKKLFTKQIGIVAALLLATSPLHIYYSQEARMYSITALLVSLVVYFWIRATVDRNRKWWVLFAVCILLTVGFDYLAGVILLPLFILTVRNKSQLKAFLVSLIPLILAGVVYSPVLISQLSSGLQVQGNANGWWNILGVTNLKNLLLVPVKFLIGRISFTNKYLYAGLVSIFFLTVGYLSMKARGIKYSNTIFLWLLWPVIVLALVGLFVPVFVYFRILFCLPALYLVCSVGLFRIKEDLFLPFLSLLLVGNLFFSYLYLSNVSFQREDWKSLSETITNESKDGSAITVFVQNAQMEAYRYYQKDIPATYGAVFEGKEDTVWLMRYVYDVFDPSDSVREKVEGLGYKKVEEKSFNGVVVWKYKKSS